MKKRNKFLVIEVFILIFVLSFVFAECTDSQIDINSASLEELDNLMGVGKAIAENIINSRPFNSIEDLINVNRIGEKTLEKIKEQGLACVEEEIKKDDEEKEENLNEEYIPEIEVDYPKLVIINEEFNFKVKLINFPEGKYDLKIEIFDEDTRIAKILNDEVWKSTNFYLENVIENDEEEDFVLKIISDFEDARIEIKIKDSKEKIRNFVSYKISKEDDDFEEDEDLEESLEEVEVSYDETTENVNLKPIILNTKNIKSENDKELSTKNLALYGVIFFCVIFGALFFLNKKKYKNEFQ